MTLNFCSSCLCFPRAEITDICHLTQSMKCWGSNPGLLQAKQAVYQLSLSLSIPWKPGALVLHHFEKHPGQTYKKEDFQQHLFSEGSAWSLSRVVLGLWWHRATFWELWKRWPVYTSYRVAKKKADEEGLGFRYPLQGHACSKPHFLSVGLSSSRSSYFQLLTGRIPSL